MSHIRRIKTALFGSAILSIATTTKPISQVQELLTPIYFNNNLLSTQLTSRHFGILNTTNSGNISVFTNESRLIQNSTLLAVTHTTQIFNTLPSLGLQNQATRRKD